MFVAREINDFLEAHAPAAFCDGCLAKALGLANAEQVALRTERLGAMRYFKRTLGPCSTCGNGRMVISMPAGAEGQERLSDAIGNAVNALEAMRIAAGEGQNATAGDGKDPAAKALGARGGKKRAENMTPERRTEIARKAAQTRWSKS